MVSVRLEVTTKYWNAMLQAIDIKQETFQANLSVTVMLHGKKGGLTGCESLSVHESVQATWLRGVLLGVSAFFLRPSLSQNLKGKSAITESRTRYRRASLPLLKSLLAEVHLARSASCVVSDVPTTAIDGDGPRLRANKQQHRCSIASRPRDGVTSRMLTQPEAARGLGSHSLKNVAARYSVACGPETHSCGTAVGHKI